MSALVEVGSFEHPLVAKIWVVCATFYSATREGRPCLVALLNSGWRNVAEEMVLASKLAYAHTYSGVHRR